MNLIVLSHMYPHEGMPYNGIFVKEQLKAVRKLVDGRIFVISPVPWAPAALGFKDKWRSYNRAERRTDEGGITVLRPKYLNLPGKRAYSFNSYSMFYSIKKVFSDVVRQTGMQGTLIHSHALLPDGLAGGMAAREFGLKSLCTLHGSDINIYPHYSKSIYASSKMGMRTNSSLIAVSGIVKKRALEILPDAKVDIITNGVNTDKFGPAEKKNYNGRGIIFVGRLTEEKGIKELLAAFELIHKKYPDTSLMLVGEPVMKGWIQNFISDNGLEGPVEMTGVVGHDELPGYYQKGDIFVLPSYSEGMPVSMFEAMATGLPAVVSAVGGVPEVIRHKENGLLIKPRSAGDIVEKISLLLEDKPLFNSIKENALTEIRARFTWETSAKMLVAKYQELLNQA